MPKNKHYRLMPPLAIAGLPPRTSRDEVLKSREDLTEFMKAPVVMPDIRALIRTMRIERNVSQYTLGDFVSSRAYISRIESGLYIPSIKTLVEIAHALGYTIQITATKIRTYRSRQ